jgi:hypothetical protein
MFRNIEKLDASYLSLLLPPFQIIGCFGFSKHIDFAMHLDIHYLDKHYASRKAKTTYNLE